MLYSWSTFLDYPRYARFTTLIRLRSPAFYRPPFARSRISSPLFLISHFQTNKKIPPQGWHFFIGQRSWIILATLVSLRSFAYAHRRSTARLSLVVGPALRCSSSATSKPIRNTTARVAFLYWSE